MKYPFANEPLTDFSKPENVAAFRCSLDHVCSQLDRTYPLSIGGEKISTGETFASRNPARPESGGGQAGPGHARSWPAGPWKPRRKPLRPGSGCRTMSEPAICFQRGQGHAATQARVQRPDGAGGRQAVG